MIASTPGSSTGLDLVEPAPPDAAGAAGPTLSALVDNKLGKTLGATPGYAKEPQIYPAQPSDCGSRTSPGESDRGAPCVVQGRVQGGTTRSPDVAKPEL